MYVCKKFQASERLCVGRLREGPVHCVSKHYGRKMCNVLLPTHNLSLARYLLHTRKDFHLIFSLVLSPSHSLTHTHTHMHTGSNNTNVSLFLSLSLSHTHTTHIRGLLTPAKFHAVLLFPHRWYVIILQVKDPMETLTQNAYMYLEIFMCIYIYIYKYATVYVLCIYTCV